MTRIKEGGFTLTELIVAMSVFIIATTVISGIFVRAVRTQRQVGQLMAINSDASLIIERMAREIRSGYDFDLVCATVNDIITFTRPKGNTTTTISYKWNASSKTVERAEKEGGSIVDLDYTPLNASQTKVNRLNFFWSPPTGVCADDLWRITVVFTVGSQDDRLAYETNFQTTVSSRILPIDLE